MERGSSFHHANELRRCRSPLRIVFRNVWWRVLVSDAVRKDSIHLRQMIDIIKPAPDTENQSPEVGKRLDESSRDDFGGRTQ